MSQFCHILDKYVIKNYIVINTHTMPVKYKDSHVQFTRGSQTKKVIHHYMKTQSIKELLECYNNDNTKPKLRQKVKNELIRRKNLGLVNIITRDEAGNVSEFK